MVNNEQFNPERYVNMFKQHYAINIEDLVRTISERIETSTNSSEAFEILEAVDKMIVDIPNARILERYSSQTKGQISRNQEIYSVEYSGNYQNIGEVLKDFRKQAELSLNDLSKLSEVSLRSIWDTETGKSTPRKGNLNKILEVYEINPIDAINEIRALRTSQEKR